MIYDDIDGLIKTVIFSIPMLIILTAIVLWGIKILIETWDKKEIIEFDIKKKEGRSDENDI